MRTTTPEAEEVTRARQTGAAIARNRIMGTISDEAWNAFLDEIRMGHERFYAPEAPSVGWLVIRRERCGKSGCACARDPAKRHGPYVRHRWREGKRRRERYLGRLGRSKPPADLAAPLRDELQRAHDEFTARFLHDD